MSNTGEGYISCRRKLARLGLLPPLSQAKERKVLRQKQLEAAFETAPHPGRMKRGGPSLSVLRSAEAHERQLVARNESE